MSLESITPTTVEGEKSPELPTADIRYETRSLWREHHKLEMIATAIAAPASAFVVGWLFHLFSGSAMPWGAVGAGIVAAVLSIPITLFLIYSYYFVVAAPRSLYEKCRRQLVLVEGQLEAEKAKNAEPRLVGRIDCLEVEINWDSENFGVHEENTCLLKASFTLHVTLRNESVNSTTVSGFRLYVLWTNGHHQAIELPVDKYSVKYSLPRSEEWGYETKRRGLVAFRQDVEITNANHQSGDLRFFARQIPSASESSNERPIVCSDAIFRLEALDRKGQSHKIYEGTWEGLPGCGSIERDKEYFGLNLP